MANLPKVEEIIQQNLKRLTVEPVPDSELEKAKETLLVGLKLGRETLSGQASDAALNEVLGLGWDYSQHYPDLVKAVSANQIKDLARKLFAHTMIARTLPETAYRNTCSPTCSQRRCEDVIPSSKPGGDKPGPTALSRGSFVGEGFTPSRGTRLERNSV